MSRFIMAQFGGKKFVFVVSSGRTGTKAIAQHLSRRYPQVFAVHEPKPSWRLRMGTPRALGGKATREELREAGTYVRWVVNFGAFAGMKKWAAEWWPDWLPKPEEREVRSQKSEVRRGPSPRPSPGVPGEGERGGELKWGEMDAIERLAWFWSLVNSHLNRGEGVYGPKYLRVRFEELFLGDGLGRLTDWMELPRSSAMIEEAKRERGNASTGDQLPEWEKWCGADQHKVMRHCEELMRVYGYLKEEGAERREAVEV